MDEQNTKYLWLEKKYTALQLESLDLRKRIKRLKKLANERAQPAELYTKECTAIRESLENLVEPVIQAHEHFMAIPIPQSYAELQKAQSLLCKNFTSFSKGVKNYIKTLQGCSVIRGPISKTVIAEFTADILKKIDEVSEKLAKLEELLKSPAWTEDLDRTAIQIRKDNLLWLINTRDILNLLRKMLG